MRQNEEICHTVEFYLMQNPIPSTQFIATVRGTRHGMNLPLDLANRLVPDVLTAVEFLALTYRCGFLGPGGVNYLLKSLIGGEGSQRSEVLSRFQKLNKIWFLFRVVLDINEIYNIS